MPTHILVNGLGLTYKGTIGISTATIPDVCKTPSPGGPVPIPYPNIAQQSSLKGGTTTVKAKGAMIAVKGSQYGSSNGDEAGTAGGVKSSVNMKATDWITYSFDVKMDGKNACRNTDKKFHNNKNTVDCGGNIDPATGKKYIHECGEVGRYGTQCSQKITDGKFERDHVPAKAQLKAKLARSPGYKKLGPRAKKCARDCVCASGIAIVIPKDVHRGFSETCGGNNKKDQIAGDSKSKASMKKATNRDLRAIQKELDNRAKNGTTNDKKCAAAYRKAARKVRKEDTDKTAKKCVSGCKKKYPA